MRKEMILRPSFSWNACSLISFVASNCSRNCRLTERILQKLIRGFFLNDFNPVTFETEMFTTYSHEKLGQYNQCIILSEVMRAKITDNALNAYTLFSTKLKLLTTATIFTHDSKLMFLCIALWGISHSLQSSKAKLKKASDLIGCNVQMVFISGSATFVTPYTYNQRFPHCDFYCSFKQQSKLYSLVIF